MFGRLIKRERLIIVGPAILDVSRVRQGDSHKAMSDHEWDCHPLLLSQRQKLRRQAAYNVAAERHKVCDPKGVKDREKQQWIFRTVSHRFSLFDQYTCFLRSRFGFRRSLPFQRYQWGNERDLKLDPFLTE